jgi:uncharacterized protein GlcG (DUF336 family)
MVDGQLVGAVAVSGASSAQDEAIAHQAAAVLQSERSFGGGKDGD